MREGRGLSGGAAPPPLRRRARRIVKLVLLLFVLGYGAILVALFFAQTRLTFPASMAGRAGPLPQGAETLTVTAPDGVNLVGVHIPASRPQPGGRAALLGFAGNASNAQQIAQFLAELFPDRDVVAFHYRGYPPSGGSPGAVAIVADAPLERDAVVRTLGTDRIVAVGFSVGSGVAASLSAQRPLAGIILVTPFDSLSNVAAGNYRWLPVRLLFRHQIDSVAALQRSRVPTAIVAGAQDTLVRPERTDALRRAAPRLVYDRTLPGAGHNDIYEHAAFASAMHEALARIEAAQR